MIDFDAANAFVLALGKDPGSIRLRGFYPAGHPLKDSDSGRKSGPDRNTITRWQSEGRGVYLVINDGGDTDADITACRAFFAEWDDRPKDWQVTAWQEFNLPEPTIQVDTGGKSIHNYWVLSEPVSSETWKPIQTRLLDYLEADTKLKNPSRVMRLPGAMHMDKNGTPDGRTDIIHTSDNHYTVEEFAALLPSEQQLYEPAKFTDYPSDSTPDEIRDALACIPSRKPGTNTYDIYRNILWGLIKATGNEDEAISLMQSHSPEWKGIQQVARSGGARVNESTFWYWAKHYGYKRKRPVRDLPPLQPPGGSNSPDLPADNTPFRCLGFNRNSYYYMPNRGGQVIELSAGSHTKNNLMTLAPLTWWATLFQTKTGAIDWDSAVNSLIARCQSTGIYSPSLVRGRGAWCDGNSVIVHLGNRLIADGKHIPKPHQFDSRYFYENSESLDGPSDTPLSDEQATALANISERFSWESPVSANLLLGWIVLAPVCGALSWRPHIWVTGAAGSGKSTVLRDFMRPLLGGIFKAATGGTTEAGIRGALRSDAIPVLFDEFEQNELKDKSLVQSVLALARVASSEGGQIIKGTATGGTAAYEIRSMFCFSSITVGIFQKADFDRICVLSLVPAKDKPKEHWEALRREITQHCTEEVGRMLVARTIKHIPTIRSNSKVFASVLAEAYGQRFGDQNGALLAGAWSLMPAGLGDRLVTIEEAREWVGSMDMSSKQVDETDADENKCLNYILQYLLNVGGSKRMSMLELVTDYVKGRRIVSHSSFDDGESIDTLIGRYGLRVIDSSLAIANNNANLAAILRDTPWANNAFRQSLKRIPGATASANPVRFAGSGVSRATVIPLATFLE